MNDTYLLKIMFMYERDKKKKQQFYRKERSRSFTVKRNVKTFVVVARRSKAYLFHWPTRSYGTQLKSVLKTPISC